MTPTPATAAAAVTDADLRWDWSRTAGDRSAAVERAASALLAATAALLPEVGDDDAADLLEQLALALCDSLARERSVREAYHTACALAHKDARTVARVDARHGVLIGRFREVLAENRQLKGGPSSAVAS